MKYTHRLKAIRATLECSEFFAGHEVIGSSLLFVHDRETASIWLIDFAKTVVLPTDVRIDHNCTWSVGNHEDGYLIGINNLISIFEEIAANRRMADEQMIAAEVHAVQLAEMDAGDTPEIIVESADAVAAAATTSPVSVEVSECMDDVPTDS